MVSVVNFFKAFLVWTLSFQLVFQGLIVEAVAQSITPDAAAANQPTVTTAPSGTPMINIVAPNAAGVSHNKYTDFNITSNGLILNNATALATTQLGGIINANPNFSGASASLILDEVTSANTSSLNGALEIGGTKADYILVNPNGITCSGCGFINTSRATLTTGTPTFTGNALTGLSVNDGTIAIEGLGLDATKADKFDIVSRIATINGQINAQDLGVYTGRQDFDYANRTTTAKTPNGSAKPTFSIDSTALGGMYAGRITLVGTEAGVGVRFAADMGATAGDMTLTADGRLVLNANATATGNVTATSTSASVDIAKDVYAGGNATVNAGTVLSVAANASLGAAGNVTTSTATVTAGVGAKVVAGMNASGALTTNGTLNMTASTSIAPGDGFFGGGADVQMTAPIIDFSRATDDNSESVRSRGTMTLTTASLTVTNGRIAADGALVVTNTGSLSVGTGEINSGTSVALSGTSIATAATIVSDGSVTVTATAGNITNTGSLSGATTTELTASADITNSGTIKSQTGTTITATNLTNDATKLITSGTNITLELGGALTNAGDIYAPQILTINAPTITNTGTLAANNNLATNVQSFTNLGGVLYANNNFTVGGYGGATNAVLFDNASGTVETVNGDIIINADTLKNRKSVFTYTSGLANGKVSVTIASYGTCANETDSGHCFTYDWINYFVSSPIWSGGVQSARNFSNNVNYYEGAVSENSASGLMTSGRNIDISATTLSNENSTINAVGDINFTTTTLNNEAISLYNDLYMAGLNYRCVPEIGCAPSTSSAHIRVAGYSGDSIIQAGGNLTITATGGVRNGTEQVYVAPPKYTYRTSSSALSASPDASGIIDAASYADLIPGRDTLFVASSAPKPKFLFETRAVFIDKGLYLGSDYFLAQFGDYDPEALPTRLGDAYFENQLVRQAILRETGQRWLNVQVKDDQAQMKALLDGGLQASRDMNLAFGITLSKEHIAALTEDIIWYEETIYQGRTVLVPKLYLASATRANIRAKFDNKGAVLSGSNVTIAADSIDNDKGIITASNDITLTAANDITSTSAEISAGNDIALTSTDANVDITMQVNQYIRNLGGGAYVGFATNNERSKVDAGGKLTITAKDNITVKGSDIAAGGDANLTAGGDVDIGVKALRTSSVFPGDTIAHQVKNIGSTATMGGDLQINAGGDVRIKGSQIESNGDVGIAAVGAVTIESSTDTYDGVGQQGGKGRRDEFHIATQNASSISADGNIDITSGGNARVTSSTLEADGDLSLQATGNVTIESAADGFHVQNKKYKLKTITQKSSTLEAEGDVTVGSLVGDMSIISSEIDAGGDITLTTPGGTLYLGARKDYFEEHISETKNGTFISTYINRGQIDETVVPTLLTANGNLAIVTRDGVIVDYKDTGNLNDSIDQLSQASGLAWMTDLRARNDVTWNAVTEAHESWDYRSQGISPTGAAIISIAVGWAVGPAGFASEGMGASLLGAAEGSTYAAAANAGFSSLVTQAVTALVGNGGDIGAALQQLGSSATLKNLATSMITAGLLQSLPLDSLTTSTDALTGTAKQMTNFTNNLKTAIAKATIRSTVDSAINGTALSENLKSNLITAGADMVSQVGSQMLGDTGLPESDLRKVLGHAFVGGMSSAISGQDFVTGAAAGAITEIMSSFIGEAFNDGMTPQELAQNRESRVQLAGAIAATTVALAGGDAGDIYRAASIAQIARQYNAELHPSVEGMIANLKLRRDATDSLLQETDPDAVKAVLQRMADADVRTITEIDTTGLDQNALIVVQKYGSITTAIVATPEEAAGMLAGMAQSVGENAYDTTLLLADQVSYLGWLMTSGMVGNDAAQRNVARTDATVQILESLVGGTLPEQMTAYYQAKQEEAQRLYDDGYAYEAKVITSKLNTDFLMAVIGVAMGGVASGKTLLTKADEIVSLMGKSSTGKLTPNPISASFDASKWRTADGNWNYPPNDGFDAQPVQIELGVGTRIDRYGNETGSYVSPEGTPFEQRSLPATSINDPYAVYEVIKPLPVQSGQATPWFDQLGGGTQYKAPYTIEKLRELGYIKEITP